MSEFLVLPFRHGPFWNFSYLVACPETREAAVIDPAWDVAAIVKAANERGLDLRTILLTHSHSDHANGVEALVEATGADVFVHPAESNELRAHFRGEVFELAAGEPLRVGRTAIEALHTPGHSPGSMSFLAEGRLFTGDTIGVGGIGRPGPDRNSVEALWDSAARLGALPASTIIHPGHDEGPSPWSTLEAELERVPALRARSFSEFTRALERSTGRKHRHED